MSELSNRKSNSITKQVLKEIISQNTTPLISTKRTQRISSVDKRGHGDVEKMRLNEAILYLERKIQRQDTQISMLSNQLSQQINVKEDILRIYNLEKEKLIKTSTLLANSNKTIAELKKKVTLLEKDQVNEGNMKEQYEMKLNKYRDIVRKKDELLTKHQQKNEELMKSERQLMGSQAQVKSLRESFIKLKGKEEILTQQVEAFKKKFNQTAERLREKEEALMMTTEKLKRLTDEYDELNEMYNDEIKEAKKIEISMKQLMQIQMIEMNLLRNQSQREEEVCEPTTSPIQINVYKNQIKRVFNLFLKDQNLRKKLQKTVLQILQQVQKSFNSVLHQISHRP